MNSTTSERETPRPVNAPTDTVTKVIRIVMVDLAALILPCFIPALTFFGLHPAWFLVGLIAPLFVPAKILGISLRDPSVVSQVGSVAALVVFFVLAVIMHFRLPRRFKWIVPFFLSAISLVQFMIFFHEAMSQL